MSEKEQVRDMLKQKVWAVIGASDDEQKYGHKIFKLLKKAGYKVYPVNPGLKTLLGDTCYPSLTSLPEKPDAVNFVVPPKIGEPIVAECAKLGIKNVWFQPGANGDRVVNAAQKAELNVIYQSCILVAVNNQNQSL